MLCSDTFGYNNNLFLEYFGCEFDGKSVNGRVLNAQF